MKFLCEQCKAKYQIADEKVAGKTVRMKCRKCGHLIEMRAAVTESSAPSPFPSAPPGSSIPPAAPGSLGPPRSVARPAAPPRATTLAASLTASKPTALPKPDRLPGALAGAFKTSVQREEEVSAPFDMSELSPGDAWYVAVNGVPVGPVRVAEIRRKAALGTVTEDSLVWQEGLDEWRPLRSFPDLAAMVREAAASGRTSVTPPPPTEARGASLAPPGRAPSGRPIGTSPRGPVPQSRPAPMGAVARNNVVAITSRLSTAERLDEPAAPFAAARSMTPPPPEARSVPVGDPFGPVAFGAAPPPAARGPRPVTGAGLSFAPAPNKAMPGTPLAAYEAADDARFSQRPLGPQASFVPATSSALAVAAPSAFADAAPASATESAGASAAAANWPQRAQVPWIPIGMIAGFMTFGGFAAVLLFGRPPVAAPAPAPRPAPPPASSVVDAVLPPPAAPLPSALDTAIAAPGSPSVKPPGPSQPKSGPAGTGAAGRTIDLHGLSNITAPSLGNDPSSDVPRTNSSCISEGQVQQVIQLHQVAIRRTCWERNSSSRPTANVTVSLTVAADGTAQNVSASGDDPSVAKCIENDVRGWHFAAMGCAQKTAIPFKFVKQ